MAQLYNEYYVKGLEKKVHIFDKKQKEIIKYIDRLLKTDKRLDLDAILITIKSMLEF